MVAILYKKIQILSVYNNLSCAEFRHEISMFFLAVFMSILRYVINMIFFKCSSVQNDYL